LNYLQTLSEIVTVEPLAKYRKVFLPLMEREENFTRASDDREKLPSSQEQFFPHSFFGLLCNDREA